MQIATLLGRLVAIVGLSLLPLLAVLHAPAILVTLLRLTQQPQLHQPVVTSAQLPTLALVVPVVRVVLGTVVQ